MNAIDMSACYVVIVNTTYGRLALPVRARLRPGAWCGDWRNAAWKALVGLGLDPTSKTDVRSTPAGAIDWRAQEVAPGEYLTLAATATQAR